MKKKANRIEELKQEFKKIKSPDISKTIRDRIERFNNVIKKNDHYLIHESPYYKGYLLAIRGENPTLFDLLKENFKDVEYSSWDRFSFLSPTKSGDTRSNAAQFFRYVMEGYSLSYHITFLEEELKNINSDTNEIHEQFVKLKWLGQKNQLYDVLRELKSRGFIGSSYEDIAVFLKQNIDIFHNTALSTIQKEIGKDKKPPKSKRIHLSL